MSDSNYKLSNKEWHMNNNKQIRDYNRPNKKRVCKLLNFNKCNKRWSRQNKKWNKRNNNWKHNLMLLNNNILF